MVMNLNRLISWLRYRVRAFLGIDTLPTRLETIAMRDDLAKYHREVMETLIRAPHRMIATSLPQSFTAPSLDWDMVQRIELVNMLQNPPKED